MIIVHYYNRESVNKKHLLLRVTDRKYSNVYVTKIIK